MLHLILICLDLVYKKVYLCFEFFELIPEMLKQPYSSFVNREWRVDFGGNKLNYLVIFWINQIELSIKKSCGIIRWTMEGQNLKPGKICEKVISKRISVKLMSGVSLWDCLTSISNDIYVAQKFAEFDFTAEPACILDQKIRLH